MVSSSCYRGAAGGWLSHDCWSFLGPAESLMLEQPKDLTSHYDLCTVLDEPIAAGAALLHVLHVLPVRETKSGQLACSIASSCEPCCDDAPMPEASQALERVLTLHPHIYNASSVTAVSNLTCDTRTHAYAAQPLWIPCHNMTGTQCHIDGDKSISNTCNCDAQTATTCRVHSVYVDHANNCQPRRSKTLASTLAAPALVLHQASACRQQQTRRILHGQGNDTCQQKGAPPKNTSLHSLARDWYMRITTAALPLTTSHQHTATSTGSASHPPTLNCHCRKHLLQGPLNPALDKRHHPCAYFGRL